MLNWPINNPVFRLDRNDSLINDLNTVIASSACKVLIYGIT